MPPTRQIDQAMINVVEVSAERLKGGDKLNFDWFVEELTNMPARQHSSSFGPRFRAIFMETTARWRAMFSFNIDQLSHSREYQPDLWARDEKERFVWTIEHVLPQGDRLPRHWVEMIANGDSGEGGGGAAKMRASAGQSHAQRLQLGFGKSTVREEAEACQGPQLPRSQDQHRLPEQTLA